MAAPSAFCEAVHRCMCSLRSMFGTTSPTGSWSCCISLQQRCATSVFFVLAGPFRLAIDAHRPPLCPSRLQSPSPPPPTPPSPRQPLPPLHHSLPHLCCMQGKGPAVDTAFAMFQRRRQIKQEMGHSANVSVLDRIKLEKSKMDSTAEAMKARTKQVRHPHGDHPCLVCLSFFYRTTASRPPPPPSPPPPCPPRNLHASSEWI